MFKDIPNTFVFGNNVNMYLLGGRNVHFRTNVTNISYCLFDGIDFRFIFLEVPFLLVNRPLRGHDGFFLILNMHKQLLCNEGHEGVHQLQCIDQNLLQRPQCRCSCAVLLVIQARLHHFNIPVTVFIPDEIINLLCRQTKVIFAQAFLYFLRQRVYLGQNPFIRRGQHQELRFFAILHIHHHETGRIPHLVAEVSAIIQSFPVETHIVTGCVACNQH